MVRILVHCTKTRLGAARPYFPKMVQGRGLQERAGLASYLLSASPLKNAPGTPNVPTRVGSAVGQGIR